MNVAVIGASPKPERYSHKAILSLQATGHTAFAVTPKKLDTIEGAKVYPAIDAIDQPIDTVTMYVSAAHSQPIADDILAARPNRIIFNPGAENPTLAEKAQSQGIETLNACTLVMLSTDQF